MPQRVKISLANDQGYRLLPYTDTLPRRSPLKTSLHNQQILLEKMEAPDFEEKAHQAN